MKSVLVISERDNVATALEALEPGRRLDIQGSAIAVRDSIPAGHKIALIPIASGDTVIKYGSPIGRASADIPAGAHVHTHNVSSRRGRGDLDAPAGAPPFDPSTSSSLDAAQGRLAEPPDDRNGAGTDRLPLSAGRDQR